jgi:CheY-like chemotaxis protein
MRALLLALRAGAAWGIRVPLLGLTPPGKARRTMNPMPNRCANDDPMKLNTLEDLYVHELKDLFREDNMVNQKVTLAQLRKLGYTAQAVANGLEAVKALEQESYDVILMDCQMPELDGYEATRTIRKREQDSDPCCNWKAPIYIVAMTANAIQGDKEKCLAAGMDDYVSKPVRLPDLQAALERFNKGLRLQGSEIDLNSRKGSNAARLRSA